MENNNLILGIDPGNVETAFALIDFSDGFKIYEKEKALNESVSLSLERIVKKYNVKHIGMEMIASYGMAVGKSVFDTCVWIGRFMEQLEKLGVTPEYIYRIDEKTYICHDSRAKDANVRVALIDRYAKFDFKNGKGTKKNPDTFYGVAKDIWAAVAVAVTYYEKNIREGGNTIT